MLSDDFVALRPFVATDVEALVEAARESTRENYPWLSWCHPNYGESDARNWVEHAATVWETGERNFAITDSVSVRLLGGCDLTRFDPDLRWANLGYWVRSSSTRRGVATSAVRLMARHVFGEREFNRIEIIMSVKNIASRKVAEKAGAKLEGILRNRLNLHGEAHDACMFSLIPSDLGRTR